MNSLEAAVKKRQLFCCAKDVESIVLLRYNESLIPCREIYVFVIAVADELDLKKAAKAGGEKSGAMVHVSEINALTGYIRGGCSPIGMKKQYKTVFHSSILSQETVLVSAGKIGQQVELAPSDLIGLTRGCTANIVTEV